VIAPAEPCPCGSGKTYDQCCGPFHAGREAAPTAEALMRSRFSAYALGDASYLLDTWHPSNRPARLDIDDSTEWRRLHIVDAERGGPADDTGVVEFVARYTHDGNGGSMRERSEFVRDAGRWFYTQGTIAP
jgi:SEC-C motif domain protein